MGRPLKYADHPVARLRKALSTDNHACTRAELSRRTGVPANTLTDIELKRIKLSLRVACKISIGTEVDLNSLMAGDDPLMNIYGQPMVKGSLAIPSRTQLLAKIESFQEAQKQICLATWEAAQDRDVGMMLSYLFNTWLSSTLDDMGLKSLMVGKLTQRLGLFDPEKIPRMFWPKGKRVQLWKDSQKQIDQVQLGLMNDVQLWLKEHDAPGKLAEQGPSSEITQVAYRLIALERIAAQRREEAKKPKAPEKGSNVPRRGRRL